MAEKKTSKTAKAAKQAEKKPAKKKLFKSSKDSDKEAAKVRDFNILRAPVVTEKSSLISSQSASGPGTALVLRVATKASKDEIKQAVERIYKVDVLKVRTVNYMGKLKRARRSQGRQDKFKKAYITLKEGQSVNVVEGL